MKYLLPVEPKLLPKSSEIVDIWYRQYVKYTSLVFYLKNESFELFTTCKDQIFSKNQGARNLLKFDISKMSITISISKKICSSVYHLLGSDYSQN